MDTEDKKPLSAVEQEWQLHVYEEDPDNDRALRRIRWCLHHNVVKWFAESDDDTKLYVLLVVRSESDREVRHLVPAGLGEQMVRLRRGGTFTVHARLVALSTRDHAHSSAHRWALSEWGSGRFETPLLTRQENRYGEEVGELRLNCESYAKLLRPVPTTYSFEVSTEHFAPPPPEWATAWVNAWFTKKQADECNWRRRIIFSVTIQPVLTILWGLVALGIALFCSVIAASRGVNWHMLHPIKGQLGYIASDTGSVGSQITHDKEGKKRLYAYPAILATPLIQALIVAVSIGIFGGFEKLTSEVFVYDNMFKIENWLAIYLGINALLWVGVPLLAFVIVPLVVASLSALFAATGWFGTVLGGGIFKLLERLDPKSSKTEEELKAEVVQRRVKRAESELGGFVCTTGAGWIQEPSFYEAPKVWTRLKFNKAKVALCRPFAE